MKKNQERFKYFKECEVDQELKEFNLNLGKNTEASGNKVIYVTIKDIWPKTLSRIEKIELVSAII